jgi:hypothetical protein
MKNNIVLLAILCMIALLTSCAGGGGGGGGVYHHHHGPSGFYGSGGVFRDRIIVVPDSPTVEATPLPSGPEDMPDMGMPDVSID